MNNLLEIRKLSKSYRSFSLKDVSFVLPTGYIMGFIGPNGAGKTTTIKSILNMIGFSSGEIEVFGLNNRDQSAQINDRIGVVMDTPFYVDDWTTHDVEAAVSPFYAHWKHDKSVLFSTHITGDLEKIADYITFILDGDIVFSGLKEELLEKYVLVKGGLQELGDAHRKYVVGLREHGTGFEGMVESADIGKFSKDVMIEPISLEEIVVFMNKEGKPS